MKPFWTRFRVVLGLSIAGLAVGCGDATDDESLGELAQPLPLGSDAQFVSSNIPTTMFPGERLNVQVVMRNTGSAMDGSNTWGAGYTLARSLATFGMTNVPSPTTTVGNTATFAFVITAPGGNGTFSFGARMKQDLFFGQQALVSGINVSTANTPRWSCTYVPGSSTVPTMMTPGENRFITVTVQNTGYATWGASGFLLRSQDTPASFWGNTSTALTTAVAPNGTATFGFNIKAPVTPGTYTLRRQMQDTAGAGVGIFNNAPCLDASIQVVGASALNASLISHTFVTPMAPGETRAVTVTMRNTGTQTWANDDNYALNTQNTPASLWGVTSSSVATSTSTNTNHTFSLVITAPTTPGSYNQRWQMRKFAGVDAGYFGQLVDVPVVVDGSATPQYGATVISQDIPLLITAGSLATFTIRMQNSGSATWSGSPFSLYTVNSPPNLWGVANSVLGGAETVAAGQERDFVLSVTAPEAAGTYSSAWQMRQNPGISFFGQRAETNGIVVTLCGNGNIDAGEACDDSNLSDGDGCNTLCQVETPQVIDLATDPADRTILGLQSNRQLASVAAGDVVDTAAPDIAVGQNLTIQPMGETFRNLCGYVSVYSGANLFSGGVAAANIIGADANDSLGAYNSGGGVIIGEVSGDARADLILSAPGGDGPIATPRTNSGEAYVLAGGSISGTIDLRYATVAAHILGEAANSALIVLAAADLTGDGVGDLVLGSNPLQTLYVLRGPLAGEIDLKTPPAGTVKITGPGIGATVAVGNFGSTATADLLIGSPANSPGGRLEAGSAWGVLAPVTANVNLALAAGAAGGPSVVFHGLAASDKLGGSLAVGDVAGSTAGDVLVGAINQQKAGNQVGAVNIWTGPFTSGSTFDLAVTPATTTILGRDLGDGAGSAVRTGDWTGDGVADIAIGAYAADGGAAFRDGAGEVVLVAGTRTMPATIDLSAYASLFEVIGAGARDLMASRYTNLAFADFNGDGRADLCIGSPKAANGAVGSAGRMDCFQ